jgi:hypothetical protein
MGSTGRTPNVYGIPATLNWCVEAIAQLKGQVFGIVQNGSGGGTQDLESVLSYGNSAFNQSIILEGNDYSQITISGAPDSSYVEIISPDNTNGLLLFVNDSSNFIKFFTQGAEFGLKLEPEGPVTSNKTIKFPVTTNGTVALQEWTTPLLNNKLSLTGGTMSGDINMGSKSVTNVYAPTADMDAANKAYVDTFVTGLSPKTAVRVATTAPLLGLYDNALGTIAITTTGILAVDGVNLVQGNRVLIKNQVSQIENGIYDVTTEGILGVATIFTRSSDANTGAELVSAYTYTGTEGFTQASKGYVQKTAAPITLGSSDIVWVLFNSNAYGDGTGITIGTGNLIYSNLSTGIAGAGNVGQPVRGGITSEGALTIVGSISTDPRTTTAPAVIVSSAGPLGDDNTAQVHMSVPLTVAQTSTAGYTAIRVPVTETSTGSGTKNFIEFLGGAAGTTSKFAVANTGTITVAAGANRFANDVQTIADANYTLQSTDNETWIRTGFTVPRVITVPLDATVAFPLGAQINIAQWGAGTVTFAGESGSVNIRSKGSLKTINGQWVWVTLKKVDTNEWALIGDLTT